MIPIAFATGCALLTYGLLGLWRSTASRRWPTTEAVVTEASLDQTFVSGRYGRYPMYFPRIRFEYKTTSGTLTNGTLTRLSFDHRYSDRKRAEKIVAAYPPGTAVRAYVNPKNPSEAVLLPVASSGALQDFAAWSIAGMLVLGVTLFVVLHDAP
jgi:Protein of unknown function (DUF3592)